MNQPLVNVVIPAFNSAGFIANTLQSAYAQTYKALEIIVVDDGSTDETAALVRASGANYIYQQNQGAPAARNRGLHESNGMFVAFLDSDDIWLPEKIERQMACLNANPDADFVVCHMKACLVPGAAWPGSLQRQYYDKNPPAYLPSGLLIRREVFDLIGDFDPSMLIGDDSDWLFRANDAGVKHQILQDVLLEKTIRPGSLSSDVDETQRSLLKQIRESVQRKRSQESGR